jgi:glutathione S-transferase
MKLYGTDLSPFVQRVKMQIAAKGLDVDYLPPPGGGLKSTEFLAINPIGKIACLITDSEMALPESEVILEYLEDAFTKPPLRPRKPEERAVVRLISRINDIYVGPAMAKVFGLLSPDRNPDATKAALADVNTALGHLDRALAGKKHAAGNKFTLADCTITPSLFFVVRLLPVLGVKAPLKPYKNLAKYWKTREKDAVSVKALEEMSVALKARFGM